jgi:hypothetical protein
MRLLSWRDDTTLQVRGMFRGFEILSKGKLTSGFTTEDDRLPEIFIWGAGMYPAHLNPENPVGTVQSIEHMLIAGTNCHATTGAHRSPTENAYRLRGSSEPPL